MTGLDPRTPTSDYDRIALELKALADRLSILEAPTGTQLSRTVAQLTLLVIDIQAQLDIYNASRYTNAQIDARIAAPPAGVAATGNVSMTGYLFTPAGYNYDITYTRRTAWLGDDGRLGYASSSVVGKTNIKPADIDTDAVLDLEPRSFMYRREVARRTSLRINEGVDYRPALEYGLLAHEVDEVAPWLVYHNDETGEPEGVEYSMLTVALLAAARNERAARLALEARVAKLEGAS